MPRISRIVIPGIPHHCVQRGNYRQRIFLSKRDRIKYLAWIKEYSKKYELKIWAYCLMINHVHFIAVPQKSDSLARTFNTVHMMYSQYYNRKLNKKGHLWQGRFYSCPLDREHLYEAIRYVEMNPVRAGLAEKPDDYDWSSAKAHVNNNIKNTILSYDHFTELDFIGDWKSFLNENSDQNKVTQVKLSTSTGRPTGNLKGNNILIIKR
jgi:putative transposase